MPGRLQKVLLGALVGACLLASHAAAQTPLPTRASILEQAERAADYQLANLAAGLDESQAPQNLDPTGWVQGTFYLGLSALAAISDRPHYAEAIVARGEFNQWKLGHRLYHADDYLIGQSYYSAWSSGHHPEALEPMRDSMERVLKNPSSVDLYFDSSKGPAKCLERWCWADALFMAPPSWLAMSAATGDQRYADFAMSEFAATTEYLFDSEENLFFRDSNFFDRRDPNGEKLFWSRGNGWVIAGIAAMLPLLPDGNAHKERLEALFVTLAGRLRELQGIDGFWPSSLLADRETAPRESSGTALIVHALAWGVNAGLLDRTEFGPTILEGWSALELSLHPEGRVGYVQQISDRPDTTGYDQTQAYGVGAFLLAAASLADFVE